MLSITRRMSALRLVFVAITVRVERLHGASLAMRDVIASTARR
jgi:hypothetical protein